MMRTTSLDDLALEMELRLANLKDPACWNADEGPAGGMRMLAHAIEGDRGEVGIKIMGDTLTCYAEHAIAFAEALLSAGLQAMRTRKDP